MCFLGVGVGVDVFLFLFILQKSVIWKVKVGGLEFDWLKSKNHIVTF